MKRTIYILLLISYSLYACTEETTYVYEVDTVNAIGNSGDKNTPKSTLEFISIAYADVFGTSITQNQLVNLSTSYASFGDKKVIEELIVSNFLNRPNAQIPATPSVNGDTAAFITSAYKKFYNREPNPFESYFWLDLFRRSATANPGTMYYALMTSDEYRFY